MLLFQDRSQQLIMDDLIINIQVSVRHTLINQKKINNISWRPQEKKELTLRISIAFTI